MANSLTRAYLDLPQDERDAALVGLIRTVGKDRNRLQLVTTAISDTCDPLNRLPVELVIQIFDYLHPLDVWSLRRTCQQWNSRLSSTQLTRNAINRFATQHPADSALDTNTDTSRSLALELRHNLALRLARSFTHVVLPDTLDSPRPKPLLGPHMPSFQLKGGYIAYTRRIRSGSGPDDRDPVVVRDLVSGYATTLRGQAREEAMNIALTTDVVAFITYTGTLYVASLMDLTAPPSRVRLPSSCATIMAANRNTVACNLSSDLNVIVYRFTTRKSTSFSLDAAQTAAQQAYPGVDLMMYTMSVDEDRGTIDTACLAFPVARPWDGEHDFRVIVSRFSLAGEYITQTAWYHQPPGMRGNLVNLGPLRATGERGIFSMELEYYYDDDSSSGMRDVTLAGNPPRVESRPTLTVVSATLLYNEVDMSLKAVDWMVSPTDFGPGYVPRPMLWKDRSYRTKPHAGPMAGMSAASHWRTPCRLPYDGPHSLEQLNDQPMPDLDHGQLKSRMGDDLVETPYIHSRLWPQSVQRRPKIGFERCHDLLAMNDSFVVTSRSDREPRNIEVACFDERVKLHGAESTNLWDSRLCAAENALPYSLPSSA